MSERWPKKLKKANRRNVATPPTTADGCHRFSLLMIVIAGGM
jgi:hypothetical protein